MQCLKKMLLLVGIEGKTAVPSVLSVGVAVAGE